MSATELAPRANGPTPEGDLDAHELAIFPRAAATLAEAKRHYTELRQFVASLLVEDEDYGKIPGLGKKPSLWKSGAEKLCQIYGFYPDEPVCVEKIDEMAPPEGSPYPTRPFFAIRYRMVLKAKRTGQTVAACEGECNSYEPRFQSQRGWQDPWTTRNTAIKMAQKRAFVGATLLACAASNLFTSDLEDYAEPENGHGAARPPAQRAPSPRQPVIEGKASEAPPDPDLVREWRKLRETLGGHGFQPDEVKAWYQRNGQAVGVPEGGAPRPEQWKRLHAAAAKPEDIGAVPAAAGPDGDPAF